VTSLYAKNPEKPLAITDDITTDKKKGLLSQALPKIAGNTSATAVRKRIEETH
jgi:hypothetical protein